MGAGQLLRGVAVRVDGHDVNVGMTEELVNDLSVVQQATEAHQHGAI